MIKSMKEFKWQLLIIVVIIVGSLGLAYSTPVESKDSQEGSASNVSPENKQLHQKLKEGCEIDAYIKQGDSVCEITIRIKDDFAEPIPYDDIEFKRAINIEFLKGCFPSNAQCETYNIYARDILVYIKYKDQSKKSHIRHSRPMCRRSWIAAVETKLKNYGFTFGELFRAAEELIDRDKSKLGKGNIISKKRVFKEIIPDQRFLLSPPRALRY